jgi:phosphoribosylformylglycinamidine cyclo-ligase
MISYKDAGVDVNRGYKAVELMKTFVKSTFTKNVLTDLGSFGALYNLDLKSLNIKEPVLVSGTDGVGTKLKIAIELNKHDTIGIDCVAMCVNDILCSGAKPLFFLDYIAMGKLVPEKVAEIVKGVARGCLFSDASLVGGETAEMPGFYAEDEYDIAGFAVGVVDKSDIIDGKKIREGNAIIGIASSGIHSNGYSLVRKLIKKDEFDTELDGRKIGEILLEPTKIYVKPILELKKKFHIKGIAHITGGGFIENIPRAYGDDFAAEIHLGSWEVPKIFDLLQQRAELDNTHMLNTFNLGIGLVIIVEQALAPYIIKDLQEHGEKAYQIGTIIKRTEQTGPICFV